MKNKGNSVLVSLIAAITTIVIITLLSLNIVVAVKEEQAIILIVLYVSLVIISLFTYGILQVSFWRGRYTRTVNLINTINSIDSSQEEVFEVGSLIYDDEGIISFITPWLQREGFDGLIGKNITSLGFDVTSTKKTIISRGAHKWEATVAPKIKMILFKDITSIETLRKIIDSQLKSVISFHTAFSKKLNLNGSAKGDATLKINQTIKDWVTKHGGLLNASLSTEGTVSALFNWRRGEKEIYSQHILEQLKKANSKLTKDITISIGAAYGDHDFVDLLDGSLRSLEISKNRGGDQIVLLNPDGEMEYIGLSKQQAVAGSTLNIKRFHSEFMVDITKARDVYITSHKVADLDALGSALGIKQLAETFNNSVYIVLEEFDQTAQRFFDSLPKRIKDSILTEREAIKSASSMAHFVITDTSNPNSTQAETLLEGIDSDKITIIDHHRLNKGSFVYSESKTLIETSTSSASELVVEMLKISFGSDAQTELDPYVATGLLSGIKLDSKQLSKNVTNATFESVAWLMNNEANTTETEALFRPSQNLIKIESEAFANISRPSKGIIFTYLSEENVVPDEDISILADKLMSYDGIEATFVIGKTESGRFKMSSRSNGTINVQSIAEKFGGGGHFNIAATTWPASTKYSALRQKITKELGRIK